MPQLAPAPPVMELDDEPPNKKMRSEDNLVPENLFLQRHKVRFYFNLFMNKFINQKIYLF